MQQAIVTVFRKSSAYDIANHENLYGWYRADIETTDYFTDVAGRVNLWKDQSGNGNDLADNGSAGPTTGTRTMGGLNAFDFVSDTLFQLSVSQTQPYLIYMVVERDTSASNMTLWTANGGGPSPGMEARTDDTVRIEGKIGQDVSFPLSVPAVVVGCFDGASSFAQVNLTQGGNVTENDNWGTNMFIGVANGAGSSSPFDGLIGELVISAVADSSDVRTNVVNALADRWGISV